MNLYTCYRGGYRIPVGVEGTFRYKHVKIKELYHGSWLYRIHQCVAHVDIISSLPISQVIDEGGNELIGKEGDLAIKVRPDRPVGLFSRYVVSFSMCHISCFNNIVSNFVFV